MALDLTVKNNCWGNNLNHPMYYHYSPNDAMFYGRWAVSASLNDVISAPKIINQPAYGLLHDEISIKEIDEVLTIKSMPTDKSKYCASINKSYTLKNVVFKSSSLSLGVLTIEFVDSENVIIHKVNEVE